MDIDDLTFKALTIRTDLLKGDEKKAGFKAAELQAALEDLDDKGFLIVHKSELLSLARSEWGDWEDSLCPILEKIGVDTSEGL